MSVLKNWLIWAITNYSTLAWTDAYSIIQNSSLSLLLLCKPLVLLCSSALLSGILLSLFCCRSCYAYNGVVIVWIASYLTFIALSRGDNELYDSYYDDGMRDIRYDCTYSYGTVSCIDYTYSYACISSDNNYDCCCYFDCSYSNN